MSNPTTTAESFYHIYYEAEDCAGSACYSTYHPINECFLVGENYRMLTASDPSPGLTLSFYDTSDSTCTGDISLSSDYVVDECNSAGGASEVLSVTNDCDTSDTTITIAESFYHIYYEAEDCAGSSCYSTYHPINECFFVGESYRMLIATDNDGLTLSFYGTSDSTCTGDVSFAEDYVIDECNSGGGASEVISVTNDNNCEQIDGAEHLGSSATLILGLFAMAKTFF